MNYVGLWDERKHQPQPNPMPGRPDLTLNTDLSPKKSTTAHKGEGKEGRGTRTFGRNFEPRVAGGNSNNGHAAGLLLVTHEKRGSAAAAAEESRQPI